MPKALEDCIASLMGKWKKTPESRPEPKTKGQDAKSQAYAICTSTLKKAGKMEVVMVISLEGVGPTILGAAVTNRPHIKGLPPIEIVQDGEKEKFIVPLLKAGEWRHRSGILKFTPAVYGKMIANFNDNVVGNRISIDNRHKPELGANGWFEEVFEEDGFLKAKVDPTPPGLEAIKNKQYMYASIEFHPDWEHPEIKMSSDEIEGEWIEGEYEGECPCNLEEPMPENDSVVTLEQYQELLDANQELEQSLESIQTENSQQLESLRGSYESVIARLEAQSVRSLVDRIVLEAESYRDENERGHPTLLIEWAENVLSFEEIGEGEGVIKLESSEDVKETRAYLRKSVAWLLQNLPGSVPLSGGQTEPEKERKLSADEEEISDEALKEHAQEIWSL